MPVSITATATVPDGVKSHARAARMPPTPAPNAHCCDQMVSFGIHWWRMTRTRSALSTDPSATAATETAASDAAVVPTGSTTSARLPLLTRLNASA